MTITEREMKSLELAKKKAMIKLLTLECEELTNELKPEFAEGEEIIVGTVKIKRVSTIYNSIDTAKAKKLIPTWETDCSKVIVKDYLDIKNM